MGMRFVTVKELMGQRLQSGVLKEEAGTETALAAYTQRGQVLFSELDLLADRAGADRQI